MIYVDNAATSWPKPNNVAEKVVESINQIGANPGRGGHRLSVEAGRRVFQTRENIARLFNLEDSKQIVFTLNTTDGLNMVIKGVLSPGDHVITSVLEHNSVLRPLHNLSRNGVDIDIVKCDKNGFIPPQWIHDKINDRTKMVVLNHASNVIGTVQPVEEIGKKLGEQVFFLVDAAQTAGTYPIDLKEMPVDALAFSGHKGLLGPQGTGGLYIAPGQELRFWREGGTGSHSEQPEQPLDMPDRYESGTPNTPGIAGLNAGVEFLLDNGVSKLLGEEKSLIETLYQGIKNLPGIKVYGPGPSSECIPVLSFNHKNMNSQEFSMILDEQYNIACRGGLHCAPKIHEYMGSASSGMVRMSVGPFNTQTEITEIIQAIKEIAEHLGE